jgi:hypothetical protein
MKDSVLTTINSEACPSKRHHPRAQLLMNRLLPRPFRRRHCQLQQLQWTRARLCPNRPPRLRYRLHSLHPPLQLPFHDKCLRQDLSYPQIVRYPIQHLSHLCNILKSRILSSRIARRPVPVLNLCENCQRIDSERLRLQHDWARLSVTPLCKIDQASIPPMDRQLLLLDLHGSSHPSRKHSDVHLAVHLLNIALEPTLKMLRPYRPKMDILLDRQRRAMKVVDLVLIEHHQEAWAMPRLSYMSHPRKLDHRQLRDRSQKQSRVSIQPETVRKTTYHHHLLPSV